MTRSELILKNRAAYMKDVYKVVREQVMGSMELLTSAEIEEMISSTSDENWATLTVNDLICD